LRQKKKTYEKADNHHPVIYSIRKSINQTYKQIYNKIDNKKPYIYKNKGRSITIVMVVFLVFYYIFKCGIIIIFYIIFYFAAGTTRSAKTFLTAFCSSNKNARNIRVLTADAQSVPPYVRDTVR
jgi:hypothetical protein